MKHWDGSSKFNEMVVKILLDKEHFEDKAYQKRREHRRVKDGRVKERVGIH